MKAPGGMHFGAFDLVTMPKHIVLHRVYNIVSQAARMVELANWLETKLELFLTIKPRSLSYLKRSRWLKSQ